MEAVTAGILAANPATAAVSTTGAWSHCAWISKEVSQAEEPVADPSLGGPKRDAESCGHVGVGAAAEVSKLQGLALDLRELGEGVVDPGRLERRVHQVVGDVQLEAVFGDVSRRYLSSRLVRAWAERTRFTAAAWVIIRIQEIAVPRVASKRRDVCQISRKAS